MTDNYLLDAVDRLTLDHVTKVLQEKNGITCVSDVEHAPLLQQLRAAVAGGTGAHDSGSSGSERIPLNPGALEMFDGIVKQINRWYLALPSAREDRYLWDRLRDWYTDFENRRRAGKLTPSSEHDTLKMVEGWARNIEAMFDPPKVLELTKETRVPVLIQKTRRRVDVETGESWREPVLDADGNPVMRPKMKDGHPVTRVVKVEPAECPLCGERYAHDPKTGDQMSAVIVEYRLLGELTLDKSTGLCRFCGEVWRGRYGVRELRWLIDQAEAS